MKMIRHACFRFAFFHSAPMLFALLGICSVPVTAQNLHLQSKAILAEGAHPWYEIKADPEEPKHLMICGTKWDAMANTPYGFVYASSDSGTSWQGVFEDRSSAWVTEHSCAWGRNHKAYFVSEASKIIDGQPHHEMGTTRLFVSTDTLQHWTETIKTGWADYSASAVDSTSGRLYVLFNAGSTRLRAKHSGSSIGLLVFSPDGRRVVGPFLCPRMSELNYHGVYPSHAIALKSGGVAALYHSTRETRAGWEGELGVIRADQAGTPSLERTAIAHSRIARDCLNFGDGALAYDHGRNRLFVVYVVGCKETRILLTSSDDEGKTWTKGVAVAEHHDITQTVMFPSLVVESAGALGLLWRGTRGQWFFAEIQNNKLLGAPTELSNGTHGGAGTNSLWTSIHPGIALKAGTPATASSASITVDVYSLANTVWRACGLVATGDRVLAVWPSGRIDETRLNLGVLVPAASVSSDEHVSFSNKSAEVDVTSQSAIVYGGEQDFDDKTGTLRICLALANRGNTSIRVPVKVEAIEVESPASAVSILNATNGGHGKGAVWDISDSVTGDRIPPGATSNPFCLSIHIRGIQTGDSALEGEDLLKLQMRVLGSSGGSSEHREDHPSSPTSN